jgi:hypothetical protein
MEFLQHQTGGASWSRENGPWGNFVNLTFCDSLNGWALWFDGCIQKTSDGGKKWTNKITTLTSGAQALCFPSVNVGYAYGGGGVICKTTDSGSTWRQLNVPVTNKINSISFIDENNGWAVTDNGLILHTTNGGEDITTNVEAEIKNTPYKFSLYQNYPNPFNPETTIKYSVPHASKVNIAVYNTIGQMVCKLVNKTQPEGVYTITFDGHGLPSGIYYYVMTAEGIQQAKKFLLVK